jgi:hypothetical protein
MNLNHILKKIGWGGTYFNWFVCLVFRNLHALGYLKSVTGFFFASTLGLQVPQHDVYMMLNDSTLRNSNLFYVFFILDYVGNPLTGCKRECESNFECSQAQECEGFKCQAACREGGIWQRQSTLDCHYLTLLCDNLKKRMFFQNFFSWQKIFKILKNHFLT